MLAVLTVIAIVAAGALAFVNAKTAPVIENIKAEQLKEGIVAVMGSADIQVSDPVEEGNFVAYTICNSQNEEIGKAVSSVENGFGGSLKVLVGFDNEGTILGYTILETAETPGLGAKAGSWFQKEGEGAKGGKACVVGLNPGTCNFTVSKDGGDVDAITASTITSRAFLKAIKNAYDKYFSNDAQSGATKQSKEC